VGSERRVGCNTSRTGDVCEVLPGFGVYRPVTTKLHHDQRSTIGNWYEIPYSMSGHIDGCDDHGMWLKRSDGDDLLYATADLCELAYSCPAFSSACETLARPWHSLALSP